VLTRACCRAVIENHYTFLKGLNPSLPFLVRERTDPDFEPVIQAEFAKGKMEEVSVKNMSEAEVLGELAHHGDAWSTVLIEHCGDKDRAREVVCGQRRALKEEIVAGA